MVDKSEPKTKLIIRSNRMLLVNPEELEKYDEFVKLISVFDKIYFTFKYTMMEYINDNTVAIPRYIKKSDIKKVLNDDTEIIMETDIFDNHIVGVDYKWKSNIVMKPGLQERVLNTLHANSNTVLNLRTGSGKTTISLKYASDLKVKTLVILDRKEVLQQWIARIKQYTNLEDGDILFINQSKGIKKVIDGKTDVEKPVIFLMIHRTISNTISKNPQIFVDLMSKLKIGLKIIDEAHKEMHSLFRIDSLVDIRYNLYLTATVGRSDYIEEYMLTKILPTNRISETSREVKNYITFFLDSFNSNPDYNTVKKIEDMNIHGFDVNNWCKHIYESSWDIMLDKISELIKKIRKNTKGKILILFNQKKMIDKMVVDLKNSDEFNDESIVAFHSGVRGDLNSSIIISTNKMFADAMDVSGLEVIINTTPYSSKVTSIQISGRLRDIDDVNVVYIDLVDTGFKKTLKQRASRIREFKKIAKRIIKAK